MDPHNRASRIVQATLQVLNHHHQKGLVLSHSFHCACKGVNVGVCIGVGVDSMPTTRFSMPADKSDIISDSSGVGTSNSDSTTQSSILLPGTTVVCLENYSSGLPGHLRISQGDILEGKSLISAFPYS